MRLRAVLALTAAAACSRTPDGDEGGAPLRLWHTFNRHETEALNASLEQRGGRRVEPALMSFARGQTILGEVLRAGADCPDLARIDATWLPGLVEQDLLVEVPDPVWRARAWLPEAAELATWRGAPRALPQALDGLVLVHRKGALEAAGVPWPPETLGDLEASAHRLTVGRTHGLGLRIDAYWFIAFLRASGGEVLDATTGALGVDRPESRRGLERFAALWGNLRGEGGVAAPPAAPGDEQAEEVRRFQSGEVAIQVEGPWAIHDLTGGRIDEVSVTPFPRDPAGRPAAPRGGQLYVVPRCARDAAAAWQLALDLTEPALQAEWSRRFGEVPVTRQALEAGGRVAGELYQALRVGARPLPRDRVTAEMFDDLTPAVEAVVVGDATADEALDGVVRAWSRMLDRDRDGGGDREGGAR